MSHHLILVRTGTPRAAILESTQGLQEQGQSIFQLVGRFCKIPLSQNFFSLTLLFFLSIHYFTLYKFIFPPLSIEITLIGDYLLIPESPVMFFFLSLSQQKYILKRKKINMFCQIKFHVVDQFLCQNNPLDLVMTGLWFFSPCPCIRVIYFWKL